MNWRIVFGVGLAAVLLAGAVGGLEVRRQWEFRRLIETGDVALGEGRLVEAVEAFSGAVAFKPEAMLPYLRRGHTYHLAGDSTAATRDLSHAAALDPSAPQPAERLGDVHLAGGRYEDARREYRRYLSLDEQAPQVLYKLALASYRLDAPAEAIRMVEAAIKLEPEMDEAHYLRGLCLLDLTRSAEARAAFAQALAINPAFIAAHESLADIAAREGRRREALKHLEAIAGLDPDHVERQVSVAQAYARFGRADDAAVVLRRAIERFPTAALPRVMLARLWLDDEDEIDATTAKRVLSTLREVALRRDASSAVLTLVARAMRLTGDMTGTERVLRRGVETGPATDAETLRLLAEVAAGNQHHEVARLARARYDVLKAAE